MGVLILLIAIIVYTGLHNGLFWGVNDLKVQAENMSFIAIAGVGTALLIITGNIDLSIGSVLGLTAVIAGMLSSVVPVPVAFVLAVLLGGAIGAINGVIVWNVSSSPLIITLGGLTLIRGLVVVITGGQAVQGIPLSFSNFGNLTPLGIPMPVLIMVIVAALRIPVPDLHDDRAPHLRDRRQQGSGSCRRHPGTKGDDRRVHRQRAPGRPRRRPPGEPLRRP